MFFSMNSQKDKDSYQFSYLNKLKLLQIFMDESTPRIFQDGFAFA